jgi:hypothetical protein
MDMIFYSYEGLLKFLEKHTEFLNQEISVETFARIYNKNDCFDDADAEFFDERIMPAKIFIFNFKKQA